MGGQSYQSDFRKLEDRDREQIKELKDLLSVFHRKFALFEIRLEFLERTQRRPAAVNGHFSNSVGRSIHLQTQMGDDTNTSQTWGQWGCHCLELSQFRCYNLWVHTFDLTIEWRGIFENALTSHSKKKEWTLIHWLIYQQHLASIFLSVLLIIFNVELSIRKMFEETEDVGNILNVTDVATGHW